MFNNAFLVFVIVFGALRVQVINTLSYTNCEWSQDRWNLWTLIHALPDPTNAMYMKKRQWPFLFSYKQVLWGPYLFQRSLEHEILKD